MPQMPLHEEKTRPLLFWMLWKKLASSPNGRLAPAIRSLQPLCDQLCPDPGIFIVVKGNKNGVGEAGLGQGLQRWGGVDKSTSGGRGSCNYV